MSAIAVFRHAEHEDDDEDEQERRHPVPEERPAVHVRLSPDGPWHRISIDRGRITSDLWARNRSKATTACGKSVIGYYSLREESYAGQLCTEGCFSAHEFALAAARDQAELDAEYEAEAAERARVRAETRARDREQLDIATGKIPRLPKPDVDESDESE